MTASCSREMGLSAPKLSPVAAYFALLDKRGFFDGAREGDANLVLVQGEGTVQKGVRHINLPRA